MFFKKINKTIKKAVKNYKRGKSTTKMDSRKYSEFLKAGGGLSGIYDISHKATREFVKQYREFIPKSEIYTRDKRGYLVPVYGRHNSKK